MSAYRTSKSFPGMDYIAVLSVTPNYGLIWLKIPRKKGLVGLLLSIIMTRYVTFKEYESTIDNYLRSDKETQSWETIR